MSHRKAIAWILLIWTLSALLAMPNAIYSEVRASDGHNGNCAMTWPEMHDHL